MKSLCLALLFCLLHEYYCDEYCMEKTSLHSDWKDACRDGYSIYKIQSTFWRYKKDRQWTICCRSISTESTAASCLGWTTIPTAFGRTINYQCPQGYFLNGIESKYLRRQYGRSFYVDRIFTFRCCKYLGGTMSDCRIDGHYSYYKSAVNFQVNNGRILQGLKSWYCGGCGDRAYQMVSCKVTRD